MSAENYNLSPLYRVTELIECFILENNLKSHDKLPGERKLCEMWECSRATLRSAFVRLENAGVTYSIKGMGNYAAEKKIEIYLTSYDSFFHQLEELNQAPALEFLSVTSAAASQKVSGYLNLPARDKIYEIKTLLCLDDIPAILETSWISAGDYSGISEKELKERDICRILKQRLGLKLEYGSEEISITNAQAEEAEYLEVEEGEPLFYVKKIGKTKERPVLYTQAMIRPERIQFASVLK